MIEESDRDVRRAIGQSDVRRTRYGASHVARLRSLLLPPRCERRDRRLKNNPGALESRAILTRGEDDSLVGSITNRDVAERRAMSPLQEPEA